VTQSERGARLVASGSALPDRTVTNTELESWLDTSDSWIADRTGIRERHWGGTTSELATQAATAVLASAGLEPADLDAIIVATTTPDLQIPAASALVAGALGFNKAAMDLNAACSGFVYALVTAHALVVGAGMDRVLLIGADQLTQVTDFQDRSTAVLFGDGAGAVLLEAVAGEDCLLGFDLGVDGTAVDILRCDRGGFLTMQGSEVFRRAVRATVESSRLALERAKVTVDEIALMIPHQANQRIVDAACSRLGIDASRTAMVLEHTGNTSAASVPLALDDAVRSGRVQPGDRLLLSGFGAGMTWASAVVTWGGEAKP
jgi:3-oxoacyl-[acyl-carrier-protein] synthase-3